VRALITDSCQPDAKSQQQNLTNSELELIKKFISSGDVVFDIGANVGAWTKEVLNKHSKIQAHLFEPAPKSYQKLLQNLNESIETEQAIANNCAVSEIEGKRTFYFYQDQPSWSTFHRRLKVEKELGLVSPESLMVPMITLDSYCKKMNVKRIHFLKIDTEGSELEVLRGARELLRKGKIDYLQFEYGGTFLDAGVTLEDIFQYLRNMRYELFKLSSSRLEHIEQFSSAYEDYKYSNFLAVNERFKSKLLGQPPKMLNLQDLFSQYNIVPRGIIHIGAYEGKELKTYKEMGVQKVLFIEANPAVYERLEANVAAIPNVQAVNCAISNYDGTTTLRVTSMEQSSSILPLKRHCEIYPDIKEVHQITVKCRTIDSLLKELKLAPSDFNVINVDIQGAELMAFQGATEQLKYIDAINSEVNYEQLYEGCALIDQIDDFLEGYGFVRRATTSPYHPSWGDGFYVKTQANTPRPVITMSTLGKNGRFANQLFQYAFLKIYAKQHNLEVRTPPWIGQCLFGHKDPPILHKLPLVKETTNELTDAIVANAKETFKNVDFWGYFQYNTSYYAPHKDYFRSLFKPVPEIENKMSQLMNRLRSKGKTVVGLHLRRGDYGYGYFFVTPNEWYKRWLQDMWPTLEAPVLFIASDEPEKVVGDFAEYNPVTSKDLGVDYPQAPFYPDFYILSKCDVVAISNSSFSFAACMLNEQDKHFWRPSLSAEGLIRFDPWNSETILRSETVEDRQPGIKCTAEYAKDHIEQSHTEFLELYEKRPFRNNEGGLKSICAFSLWYFLRRVRPNLVVENGVSKGLSTWLIEKTLPDADIICLEPHPEVRQYTSKNAIYLCVDFAEMDFKNYEISNALVFFHDPQNAYSRILQAWEKGFEHLIFDDNYPGGSGSHMTLQACLSSDKERAARLRQIIEEYEIFPPLYQHDEPITMEKVYIDRPALDIADMPAFELVKRDIDTHCWMTYVRLGRCHELEDVAQGGACPSANAVSVVEKSGMTISQAAESYAEKDSFQYPSFNALVSLLSPRDNYRPTIISTEEVFCGPDCETTMDADKYRTIKSPVGVYDIGQIAERLPPSQTPQLVAVKADATGRNFPINLQTLKCPKLLILGNTQHLKKPIQTLLKYALQENFDFIMSDHKRHHLHYFKEIGFEKVFWLPAFNIFPHKQPHYEDKLYKVSFVGQAGRWHPYRKNILQYLNAKGIELNTFQVPQPKAAEIYAQSLINLNISLNGDLNLRVFEVLSSGGFLLTDKLTMESGLELLFKDGQHLVCFENDSDLLDKIRYFLQHPDEAKAIAQNGYEEFQRNHTPEKKTKELSDYIFKGELNPLYDIRKDKRSIYVKSGSPTELSRRAALYEFFQEIHLTTTNVSILLWPNVDGRIVCDVLDLPRIRLFIKNDDNQISDQNARLFQNTEMAERIKLVTTEQLGQMNLFWNVLVITASELLTTGLENLLNSMRFKWLVISDGFDALGEQQKKQFKDILAAAGFEKKSEDLEIYYWKDKNLWGEILYSENKIAEAINCFEQALLENPCHCDALNNLGVISYQLEQLENAEKFLLKSVRLNRRSLTALINLSHLYLKMNRFNDAAELFEEAASLDKDDPSVWFHLGLCYEQSNRNQEALQAYKRCNELGASEWPTAEKIQTLEKRTAAKRRKKTSKIILPPKRILLINNLYPPQELGGYGRLLCDFAKILENRGHSIYVLTSDTPYLGPIDQDQPNVDRSLLLFGSWQNGVCKPIEDKEKIILIIKKNHEKLQNVIEHFSPQLCLLGNIDFLSHSIFRPLLERGIPVIHHFGSPNPGYSVADTPKEALYIPAAASRWLKEQIAQQGYAFKDFRVIYPGALVQQFKMNILPDMDKLRIAYASIVLPYKGPHILIKALKELHDKGVDFSCSLAGTSTDEKFVNSLKNFVTQTGMDDKVAFIGFLSRENLKNFFARHNVLVFPSLVSEAFGISQVEAMAAGLTVVTSGTGGAKEIVEHRLSGVIFKSGDHKSLAQELLQLTGDKEKWRQIALTGQKRALQFFDIEKSVDDIERIYCQLTQLSENVIEHGKKIQGSASYCNSANLSRPGMKKRRHRLIINKSRK